MKAYPPILTPDEAKTITEDEENILADIINKLNAQLRYYNGSSITVDIPKSTDRVRGLLLDMIKQYGWQFSFASMAKEPVEDAVQKLSANPYRAPDSSYNHSPATRLILVAVK